MATINYENKEAVSEYPSIPAKNKFTDDDANLIKTVGNQILTTLGVYTDDWSSSATYLIDDIVVYDNRYFKNLTGTNTATTPNEDTTNWLEVSIRDISGGAEIPIQDTAPANPRDDDLWIDTSDNAMSGANVLNEHSTSTSDTYSCSFINGTTLYSHSTGTTGDITLSESVADYSTIKLFYYYNHWSGKIYGSKEVSAINNSYTCLGAELQFYDLGYMYWPWSRRKLNGTTISDEAHGQGSNKSGETNNTSNDIYVYKVIGYK